MSVVVSQLQPRRFLYSGGVLKNMREQMERFVVLPFSVGCSSGSSVAVVDTNGSSAAADIKKSKPDHRKDYVSRRGGGGREREDRSSKERMKSGFWFWGLPKANLSSGIHKLIKGFKSISHIFVYKEEKEREIEIGYPTDVKHVTHIGLDGNTTTNLVKGWDHLNPPPELVSFPSISLRQFELAMAAQAQAHGPVPVDPSKLA